MFTKALSFRCAAALWALAGITAVGAEPALSLIHI